MAGSIISNRDTPHEINPSHFTQFTLTYKGDYTAEPDYTSRTPSRRDITISLYIIKSHVPAGEGHPVRFLYFSSISPTNRQQLTPIPHPGRKDDPYQLHEPSFTRVEKTLYTQRSFPPTIDSIADYTWPRGSLDEGRGGVAISLLRCGGRSGAHSVGLEMSIVTISGIAR